MRQATVENASILHQDNGSEVARNSGLIQINCTLTGVTPFLMNAMSEEVLLGIRDSKKKSKSAGKPTLREEVRLA